MGINRNTGSDVTSGNANTVIVRSESDFLKEGISLVCLNYRTPKYVRTCSEKSCDVSSSNVYIFVDEFYPAHYG